MTVNAHKRRPTGGIRGWGDHVWGVIGARTGGLTIHPAYANSRYRSHDRPNGRDANGSHAPLESPHLWENAWGKIIFGADV